MRWWSVILLIAICVATRVADGTSTAVGEVTKHDTKVTQVVRVSALGSDRTARALQGIVTRILAAAEYAPRAAPQHPQCARADQAGCMEIIEDEFMDNKISVAIASVPAEKAPVSVRFHDFHIEELTELAPASRRACIATRPPARSLLDLSQTTIASVYRLSKEDIYAASDDPTHLRGLNFTLSECLEDGESCATLLTSSYEEAEVLANIVRENRLHASVMFVGDELPNIALKLSHRPIIVCDWAPEISLSELKGDVLGPPPCFKTTAPIFCPFETRRLVIYGKLNKFDDAPSVVYALVRLALSEDAMRALDRSARKNGPDFAAKEYFKANEGSILNPKYLEVGMIVFLPIGTQRELYNIKEMQAAVHLIERELYSKERELPLKSITTFKPLIQDDKCHSSPVYNTIKEPNTSLMITSAVAGPACGAGWATAASMAHSVNTPLLAFTPQAPVVGTTAYATQLQILFAGDAREQGNAFSALMAQLSWRRLAALTEAGTRAFFTARDSVEFVVHTELPESSVVGTIDDNVYSGVNFKLITEWASQAVKRRAHILYLCVEDERVARAALCAARSAGACAGAVWLLCRPPGKQWLQAADGEPCTRTQLEEVATGYFTAKYEWQVTWESRTNITQERLQWEQRWRREYRRIDKPAGKDQAYNAILNSTIPSANAALLYDTIKIWATTVLQFLVDHPMITEYFFKESNIKSLIENFTATEHKGLTGNFDWVLSNDAHARRSPLILSQWDPQTGDRVVGRWSDQKLTLDTGALRWYTEGKLQPDDGSEQCTLQQLANALNTDCRTAFITLGTIIGSLLILGAGAGAYHCKRRAEKDYKKRLAELGMRPLINKHVGLDKWEIPRERVVINRKLGTGAFGTVYGGHSLLAEDRGWSAVAVKTLKAGATTEEKLDFLSEAEAMKRFDHKNVVRLLGVVTKTEPVCTVMEFMLYGDLKNYLLARRHLALPGGADEDACGEADEASPRRLTGMALDVARALSYLAQLRYVHRDVAARNCLVSARRVVKLADFGMTRLVFENDYYRFSRKGMLPVRWMAPESLALGVFSPASDVWSFGVLLYEIVTFGSLPFQGFSNSEVLTKVKGGQTLDLPPGLKPQLEGLIKSCWQHDSKARPSASEVAAFLADAPRLLAPCLDVPLDALPLDGDPPWRLPRDQAEARWVSWAAPASAATDTTYLSTDVGIPLETDSFISRD